VFIEERSQEAMLREASLVTSLDYRQLRHSSCYRWRRRRYICYRKAWWYHGENTPP